MISVFQVVENPNGAAVPSHVLQVDELVYPTTQGAMERLSGGAEIISHDKPVKLTYADVPSIFLTLIVGIATSLLMPWPTANA
jgi:hypothetical protein